MIGREGDQYDIFTPKVNKIARDNKCGIVKLEITKNFKGSVVHFRTLLSSIYKEFFYFVIELYTERLI